MTPCAPTQPSRWRSADSPESGADLCSQPTMSRLENLPTPTTLKRIMASMIELFCDSFARVWRRIVLDIDDTEDRAHGRQQLARFHEHHNSRCFLPIDIDEAITGRPIVVILRPGKPPDGRGGSHSGATARHSRHPRALATGRHPGARRQPLWPA